MVNSCSHCLRPLFTENLIKTLQKGTPVNVIGEAGHGRRRLLEDIQNYKKLRNTKIVLVDMKHYWANYSKFVSVLWQQFDGSKSKAPSDFGELLTRWVASNKYIILLLHHFDDLLENPQLDERFDVTFFDHLNSFKNHTRITLVCVTEKPHEQGIVLIKGQPHRNSWLEMEKVFFPPLSYEEIKREIVRYNLALEADVLTQTIDVVEQQTRPYDVLQFFIQKLSNREDRNLELTERFAKWKGEFERNTRVYTHLAVMDKFFKTLIAWKIVIVSEIKKLSFVNYLIRTISKWWHKKRQ